MWRGLYCVFILISLISSTKGAVILHSDPSCWDDVLLPARSVFFGICAQKLMEYFRLSASCASCQTASVPADFFFRCGCGSHNADETTVPLHLINSNLDEVNLAKRALWTILSSSDAMPCLHRGGGTSGGVLLQASHLRSLLC